MQPDSALETGLYRPLTCEQMVPPREFETEPVNFRQSLCDSLRVASSQLTGPRRPVLVSTRPKRLRPVLGGVRAFSARKARERHAAAPSRSPCRPSRCARGRPLLHHHRRHHDQPLPGDHVWLNGSPAAAAAVGGMTKMLIASTTSSRSSGASTPAFPSRFTKAVHCVCAAC